MDLIKSGQTWVIRTGPILDVNGARLTGLTDIKFSVSRYTGGAWQWLDTADMTFRASPAGYQFTMTAVDATKVAGVYGYALDTSTITNVALGDRLFIDIQQVTLTNAVNANQAGEGTYGYVIDKVEANLTTATSTLATSSDLATAQGNITTILGYGAPPSAATISTQVNADITTAHGAGSYQTASTAGLATATNVTDATTAINAHTDSAVAPLATTAQLGPLALEATLTAMKGATFDGATDSLEALRNRGDAAWITATGFATPTNVTDAQAAVLAKLPAALVAGRIDASVGAMQADVLTASALAASAVTEVQSGLATSAALATMQSNVTTILGYGAAPSAASVATEVWATAYGTPSINTFGWLLYRLGQWGTEICQKKVVGQNLLLQSIGGGTTYATVPLKDVDSNPITPDVGEPAQFLPTA